MEVEVVEGVQKGTKYYIHDGYLYRLQWKKGVKRYLRCLNNDCPKRASFDEESFTCNDKPHNHERVRDEIEKYRFREKLRKASANSSAPLKKIYNDVAQNYRDEATVYSYVSAETLMRRERSCTQPPIPRNLCTLRDYLASSDWEHLGKTTGDPPQPFFQCLLQAEDGSELLVFVSPEVSPHLNCCRAFHMDGTFKVVPRGLGLHQLTTIHTVYQNKVYAAIYALMTKRNKAAYVLLLNYVKSQHPQMQPIESMCDFETAELEAILEVFPRIQARGCWFHFAQAVWKKHKTLGLLGLCANNITAKKILRMVMCLPLLPENLIAQGVNYLQGEITMENLNREFGQFMTYLNNYWLQRIGASVLSVHRCPRRTNNDVESFHLQLFILSGKQPHPSLWDFIRILVNMNRDVSLKFLTHRAGGKPSRPKRKGAVNQDRRIRTAEESLLSGAFTVGDFLDNLSHSVASMEAVLRGYNDAAEAIDDPATLEN